MHNLSIWEGRKEYCFPAGVGSDKRFVLMIVSALKESFVGSVNEGLLTGISAVGKKEIYAFWAKRHS